MIELLLYLLYGNGMWMNRWHCSGHDFVAYAVSVTVTCLMFSLYLVYAQQNHQSLRYVRDSVFRQHLIELRNVFVVCGSIHVLSSAVSWWVPMYYLTALCMWFNCYQCARMLRSKRDIMAIHEHTRGVAAAEQVEDIRRVVQEAQADGLHNKLDELELVLKRTHFLDSENERGVH